MSLNLQTFLQTETIYPTLFYIALKDLVFDEHGNKIYDIGKLFDLQLATIQIRTGISLSGLCSWMKQYNAPPHIHFKNQLNKKDILCSLMG